MSAGGTELIYGVRKTEFRLSGKSVQKLKMLSEKSINRGCAPLDRSDYIDGEFHESEIEEVIGVLVARHYRNDGNSNVVLSRIDKASRKFKKLVKKFGSIEKPARLFMCAFWD